MNQADSIFFSDPLAPGDPVVAQWQPEEVHFLTIGGGAATPAGVGAPMRKAAEAH